VYVIRGEYNNQQLEDVYIEPELLGRSLEALRKYAHDRHSVVIFAQSRNHGKILQQAMLDNDMDAVFVDGETPKHELAQILNSFERREFKHLINVALLVEGWDCPSVDCVAIFAATMSKGKFEQIIYRGTRLAPHLDKRDFMVIDLGGNFERHGALGSPLRDKGGKEGKKPVGRICPSCETFCELKATQCPDCGYEFPPAELRTISHNSYVDSESATVYEKQPLTTYDVRGVLYKEHKSKKGNVTLRVDYYCDTKYGKISEYLSPYSSSEWARNNAWKFFKDRGKDIFGGIENYKMDDLLFYAETLKKPMQIIVDHNEQFPRVKDYIFDGTDRESNTESPSALDARDLLDDDTIPF
jgi:DNA repair protein RadD